MKAKTKTVQNSFISGVFNDKAFGRTDIGRFHNAVAEANNMVLATTGGMFKRPGFEFVNITEAPINPELSEDYGITRIIDFVFNTDQKYLFLMYEGYIFIYHVPTREQEKKGVEALTDPFAVLKVPELTSKIIKDLCVIQRGDTTLLFHTELQTRIISRLGYEDFSFGTLEMIPPLEDIEDPTTEMWSDTLGWPSYGSFFQGRLFCAGSKSFPLTVWGSKTQDYFDFQIAVTEASEPGSPITDTIDSDKINEITGIFGGRSLQVFTTGAEFINGAQLITPLDSAWMIQTRYGSNTNVALDSLDGSTFFIDRFDAVREFIYDFAQEAHVSNDLTTLSSQLFNNPFRLETIKSAKNNLGRFTYVLNSDGSLAVLNFNKAENIIAWVRMTSSIPRGKIIDISTVDNELYILVQSNKHVILERLDLHDTITYYDDFTVFSGSVPLQHCGNSPVEDVECSETIGSADGTQFYMDKIWCEECPMFFDLNVPPIDKLTGLERFEGMKISLSLDYLYQGEFLVENGELPISRPFSVAQVGFKFNSELVTLPITSLQNEIELNHKRIIKIQLYMYQSGGFYIDDEFIPNDYWDISNFDTKSYEKTGVYEYYTLGWDTLVNYRIHSSDPYGFNVLKTGTFVDVSNE